MAITGLEVKRKFWAEGSNLKKWAADHGYDYGTVSRVVSGRQRGNYGKGYEIAVALGLKDGAIEDQEGQPQASKD